MSSQFSHSFYSGIGQPQPFQNGLFTAPPIRARSKPGRKPSALEPANKRLAQNRIAQRAYRERKENHLRQLEERVRSLEIMNYEQARQLSYLENENQGLKNTNMQLTQRLQTLDSASSNSDHSSPIKDSFVPLNFNTNAQCAEVDNFSRKCSLKSVQDVDRSPRLPGIHELLNGLGPLDEVSYSNSTW